jgi:hypothetical protein
MLSTTRHNCSSSRSSSSSCSSNCSSWAGPACRQYVLPVAKPTCHLLCNIHVSSYVSSKLHIQASLPEHRQRLAAVAATTASGLTPQTADAPSSNGSDWRTTLITKSLAPEQLVRLTLRAKIQGDAGLANIKQGLPSATATAPTDPSPAATAGTGNGAFGAVEPGTMPFKQLTMRPVLIKGKVVFQVSVLTARQVSLSQALLIKALSCPCNPRGFCVCYCFCE